MFAQVKVSTFYHFISYWMNDIQQYFKINMPDIYILI